MSTEFWAIIGVGASLFATAVALGILLYYLTGGLRGEIAGLRERMTRVETIVESLVERMARLEGLFDGYVRGNPRPPVNQ